MSSPLRNLTPKKIGRPPAGWKRKFVAALAKRPVVEFAAAKAGVSTFTAYKYRKLDKAFGEQWADAIERGVQSLESECWRRAKEGVTKGHWMIAGKDRVPTKVATIREYSDTLAIFLLKAHAPEKYRENVQMQHIGANGGPVEFIVGLSKAELPEAKEPVLIGNQEEPIELPEAKNTRVPTNHDGNL